MRAFNTQWRRAARWMKWLGYGAVAGAVTVFAADVSDALAQGKGRNRGNGNGNNNGGVRVQGGGNARVQLPAGGGNVGGNVGGGAGVRLPNVNAGGAGGQVRVPGAGGEVRVPGAGGQIRVPGAGGEVRVPGAGGEIRTPGVGANVRDGIPNTSLRPNLDREIRGGARLDGSATAQVPGGVHIDPSVASQANLRFSPKWANPSRNQQELTKFRTSLNGALQNQIRAAAGAANIDAAANTRLATSAWLSQNPQRATYWSNWGGNARNSFRYGSSPYFNYNFWNARNLIGIGLGGYGYGSGGFGNGGYGGWWGYQPWLGYRPWWYWYGRPGWGSMLGWFSGYGWNQPYYYDYGPGGNVVYSGNQVLVNSQPVGTPVEYAQSAAELAAVDPAAIGQTKPEDWMALGTFTLSTAQDERDPARVLQLAVNKEGLISGTSYNKRTDKTYTVQGRVDKETQRVAFTIGNATDLVLETGMFNLTQEETPVLAHLGPSQTTTYLLARLPEPQHEAEAGQTTAAEATPVLP